MTQKRLVLIGLWNESNFGDPIIAHTVRYLFVKQFGNRLKAVYLLNLEPKFPVPVNLFFRVCDYLKIPTFKIRKFLLLAYYRTKLQKNDFIVLCGGGLLKYKYQFEQLGLPIISLLTIALKKDAHVALNAVGVEGYDSKDFKCLSLSNSIQKAVDSEIIKYVSVRDDLESMKKYLPPKKITCCKVADPAVWAAEAYGVSKRLRSNIIGVGVIRGNIFIDNGIQLDSTQLFQLYVDLVIKLTKEGFSSIELFTNGHYEDNNFAIKIHNHLTRLGIKCSLRVPQSPRDLVEVISSFNSIITARLHSCIVAYSLRVPFVALVWNSKLRFFCESIEMLDSLIEIDQFKVETIVERFKRIKNEEFVHDESYRNSVKQYIEKIGNAEIL